MDKRPKELDELREIARLATRKALEDYEPMLKEWEENLTLGTRPKPKLFPEPPNLPA